MRSWNIPLSIVATCSLISLIIIVLKYDPFVVGWQIKVLFFASLTLFLSGIGALIFGRLMLKIRKHKDKKSVDDFS